MRVRDYIGEATDYDKKARLEVKRPKSWLKSVSAFANGSGLRKMRDSYRAAANNPRGLEPSYYSDDSVFWVTLPNLNYGAVVEAQVEVAQEAGRSTQKPDFRAQKVDTEAQKLNTESQETGLEAKKQALDVQKTGLADDGQAFARAVDSLRLTRPTKRHVLALHERYGTAETFARADVMELLGLTPTPATNLMGLMRRVGLIREERTAGRGKYRFCIDTAEEDRDGR